MMQCSKYSIWGNGLKHASTAKSLFCKTLITETLSTVLKNQDSLGGLKNNCTTLNYQDSIES